MIFMKKRFKFWIDEARGFLIAGFCLLRSGDKKKPDIWFPGKAGKMATSGLRWGEFSSIPRRQNWIDLETGPGLYLCIVDALATPWSKKSELSVTSFNRITHIARGSGRTSGSSR